MAIQLSLRQRNARLDSFESVTGPSPTLRIRSGAAPANTAAARAGTVLATIVLPADWMSAASGASKAMLGTWEDQSADAAGTAAHWDITSTDGTVDSQGTISATGGGGDMEVDNVVFAAGQRFTITTFSLNEPNS